MQRSLKTATAVGALAAAALVPSVLATGAAAEGTGTPPPPTLTGRAILPAEALAKGPPSGAAIASANGITFPRPSQPVIGFSAVLPGRSAGEYLAMPDNGYGSKTNSADFLIRAYYVKPDFETATGGSGEVKVSKSFIEFRDPRKVIGFPIVNDASKSRLLTGADIDPESLQRGQNGDFWMGDEFGPWILHFDNEGVLLEAPYAIPGIVSPNNPFLVPPATATQPNSRGFEAMAISPDGTRLYAILEGATVADSTADPTRHFVYEFDTRSKQLVGQPRVLRSETGATLFADAWAVDAHRLVVIERDAGRGLTAVFRNVYTVDLRTTNADGSLAKTLTVDLANIPDPNLISLPERDPGDVGLGNPFRVTCESIEAIQVVSATRLLLGCDNNLPNTGRNPVVADDTELILVDVARMRPGR